MSGGWLHFVDVAGISHNSILAVARIGRGPPLAVSPAGETSLRSSIPTRKARRRFSHPQKYKNPAGERGIYIFVDTLSENWNQVESYVFDAYEMIRAANLGGITRETVA